MALIIIASAEKKFITDIYMYKDSCFPDIDSYM